jgi:uncharacterized protein YcbK (DUF882 family)
LEDEIKKLSKYVSLSEVVCKCGCGLVPTKEMLDKFDQIRESYGKPLHITSGARCEKQNKKIGGSPKSNHVLGMALDVVRTDELEKFILGNLDTMDVCIEDLGVTLTWIHVQVVPPKSGNRVFEV